MLKGVNLFAQSADDLTAINDSIAESGITGQDLLVVAILVGISIPISSLVARYTKKLVENTAKKTKATTPVHLAKTVGEIVKWTIRLAAVSVSATYLGLDVGFITIFLVLAAIIFVLMIRPLIETTAAGLLLQSRAAFSVGDEIATKKHMGKVIEINARSTVLKTADNKRIHIPNTEVLSDPIVVYTAFAKRRSELELLVDYKHDLDKTTQIILEAATDVSEVKKTPPPVVLVTGFDKSSYKLLVRWWHDSALKDSAATTDKVARSVSKAFKASDVKIYS